MKEFGLFAGGAVVGLVIGSLATAVFGWPHIGKFRRVAGPGGASGGQLGAC